MFYIDLKSLNMRIRCKSGAIPVAVSLKKAFSLLATVQIIRMGRPEKVR
jgi:hypothetical protein